MSAPLYVTIPEAARLLSVSRTTIYNEIRAGRIHTIKVRSVLRIPRATLEHLAGAN